MNCYRTVEELYITVILTGTFCDVFCVILRTLHVNLRSLFSLLGECLEGLWIACFRFCGKRHMSRGFHFRTRMRAHIVSGRVLLGMLSLLLSLQGKINRSTLNSSLRRRTTCGVERYNASDRGFTKQRSACPVWWIAPARVVEVYGARKYLTHLRGPRSVPWRFFSVQ